MLFITSMSGLNKIPIYIINNLMLIFIVNIYLLPDFFSSLDFFSSSSVSVVESYNLRLCSNKIAGIILISSS